MIPPAPCHHVFIDFENVHELDLSLVGRRGFQFTLMMGAQQTKLGVEVVEKLLQHSEAVQIIRLQSIGKNALDFALSYYVGQAVLSYPGGQYHIVSKDTGYDPLVQHLRSRQVAVSRHEDFRDLIEPRPKPGVVQPEVIKTIVVKKAPSSKLNGEDLGSVAHVTMRSTEAKPAGTELERVVAFLKKSGNRPKREKTLLTCLAAFLQKDVANPDIPKLIQRLIQSGRVKVDTQKALTYHF